MDALLLLEENAESLKLKTTEKNYDNTSITSGVCDFCKRTIIDSKDLFKTTISCETGKRVNTLLRTCCWECLTEWKKIKEDEKEIKRLDKKRKMKIRRVHSYIWSSLVLTLFIILSVLSYLAKDNKLATFYLVFGLLAFASIGCAILNNTFVSALWYAIFDWGFIKMPGAILVLGFGSVFLLIILRVLLFPLAFIVASVVFIMVTLLAMVASVFGYPFSLRKSYMNLD